MEKYGKDDEAMDMGIGQEPILTLSSPMINEHAGDQNTP